MKKFEQPKMKISTFITDNIVTTSVEPVSKTVLEQGVGILSENHSVGVETILKLEL
jgi:hypothetical protein